MRTFSTRTALCGCALAGLIISAFSGPALAQDAYTQHQLGVLEAQQQMDRFRGVAQQNELNALTAQVQTERALQDLRGAREATALARTAAWSSPMGEADEVQIPEDRLAESNARIRAILARDGR